MTESPESWTEFFVLIARSFAPFVIGAVVLIGLCLGLGEMFCRLCEWQERQKEEST